MIEQLEEEQYLRAGVMWVDLGIYNIFYVSTIFLNDFINIKDYSLINNL